MQKLQEQISASFGSTSFWSVSQAGYASLVNHPDQILKKRARTLHKEASEDNVICSISQQQCCRCRRLIYELCWHSQVQDDSFGSHDILLGIQALEEELIGLPGWQEALSETFSAVTQQVISLAPHFVGAVLLLLVGWLIARILRISVIRVVSGLDALFARFGRGDSVRDQYLKSLYARVAGRVVFWIVLLFFIAASANLLGWNLFAGWLDALIGYLPNLITGLFIILAGIVVSGFARAGVMTTASSAGIAQASLLSRTTQIVVIFVTAVVGIEQLGINVDFLTTILIVLVGVLVAGAALAFSLGAQHMVANMLGAHYLSKFCAPGDLLEVDGVKGELVEIGQTNFILEVEQGRLILPAKLVHQSGFRLVQKTDEKDGWYPEAR